MLFSKMSQGVQTFALSLILPCSESTTCGIKGTEYNYMLARLATGAVS